MKAINPNIYPKDGYWFEDTDGSKHVGQSWGGVIARVKAYRARQGKTTDSVDEEVIMQACKRNPVLCTEDSAALKSQTRYVSLKGRILLWLNRVRQIAEKTPLVWVNDGMHAARSDVCIRCPNNTGLPEGCGSCLAARRALTESIIGSRKSDQRLAGCAVLGEYLQVSTWIDMTTVDKPELPAECWRKRTL